MSATLISDFLAIVRVLDRHNVDFIIVGGVAAVLHGSPVTTFDLDVVHSRTETNIQRLLDALDELDAHYRFKPQERRRPDASHVASLGHQLLMTQLGPLDLLGSIGDSHDYLDLLSETESIELEAGMRVPVLSLGSLIRIKEETARPQDLAVLPLLRRTLKEKRGGR